MSCTCKLGKKTADCKQIEGRLKCFLPHVMSELMSAMKKRYNDGLLSKATSWRLKPPGFHAVPRQWTGEKKSVSIVRTPDQQAIFFSNEVSVVPPLSNCCCLVCVLEPRWAVDEASFALEPQVAAHPVVVLRLEAGPSGELGGQKIMCPRAARQGSRQFPRQGACETAPRLLPSSRAATGLTRRGGVEWLPPCLPLVPALVVFGVFFFWPAVANWKH